MNLTRWSIRLPGSGRRNASQATTPADDRLPAPSGTPDDPAAPAGTDAAPPVVPAARTGRAFGNATHPAPPAETGRPIDPSTVHELLGQVPAPMAVLHGSDHRLVYVNDAYTDVFGPRTPGGAARDALPELVELGLITLMDQVRRSDTSRTVKSRRVPGQPRDSFYTFTCAPVELTDADGSTSPGVLVFAADVTDQMVAAERLRESEAQERATAVTLQRNLLPQELEQPDELRVAAVYRPGGTEAAVGGDWYDVITLGAGRTALVIGDVMGRGVRAAAIMGQLRTAVRAYARLDLPPHEVIQLLDGLAADIDPSQIATCLYAVHDPDEETLRFASAGHLPIFVLSPDGTVSRSPEPIGPPLGTGGWIHTSGSVPFPVGSSAVLCTDGLVERRDADIDDGLTAVENALAGPADSPQIICDRLLRALGIGDGHGDDVAVLAVASPERDSEEASLFRSAALDLLGGVEAAPRARAFADGVLASWRFSEELRELGVLTASELVANSLVHGTAPMRLRLRRTDRRLIIEVTDGDEHLPRRQQAELADEAGRGISVVSSVANAWGSRRLQDGGKSVWAEFTLPGDTD